MTTALYERILTTALSRTGIGAGPALASPIRIGENAVIRLPGSRIARIARPGQTAAAEREVTIARLLADNGIPAVRALDIDQPVDVEGRAVTFWEELAAHTPGTITDVARLLRALHDLPLPTEATALGRLDPFVRLDERIADAATLADDDRRWLRDHLAGLRNEWQELPGGLEERLVHGDAWVGNTARFIDGSACLLDLERCSIGRPEWDLVSTAIKTTSFAWVPTEDYEGFVEIYGHDVTCWPGFATMRDIRELRMALYFAQHAPRDPAMHTEALLRLECLQGLRGSRPWPWTPAT